MGAMKAKKGRTWNNVTRWTGGRGTGVEEGARIGEKKIESLES